VSINFVDQANAANHYTAYNIKMIVAGTARLLAQNTLAVASHRGRLENWCGNLDFKNLITANF